MARDEDFAALFERDLATRPSIPQEIAIESIRPNPFQARTTFEGIDELAQSIRAHGFTSRLRVRRDPSAPRFFQLVFGERRLRAAKQAGLTTVPCDVAEHTDDELAEIGLAENIQRRDLQPLEEATSFRSLIEQRGYTHARLAERIGKERAYVEDRLALLRVPEDVRQMVSERPDSLRVAREIAKVPSPEERRPLIQAVLARDLSQHAIRGLVREAMVEAEADTEARRVKTSTRRIEQPSSAPHTPDGRGEAAPSTPTAFERALERDANALRVICARWRQAVPRLSSQERNSLLATIDRHLDELERIGETLRD
jgi:ParB family chromosome partitioning protein